MPSAPETHLLTYNTWTLRVRHGAREGGRLLLLLHGWTGDENSMWVFVRDFPPRYWLLAPRAPYPASRGGYSWRVIRPGTWGHATLDDLRPSTEALVRFVDEWSLSVGLGARSFDVMGFSQGGALAAVLSLLYPERVGKVAVLSAFVPEGAEPYLRDGALTGKSYFIAHGRLDGLVPPERARRSVALLEEAGARVTFCEAEVGHKVGATCLSALRAFFEEMGAEE